MTTVRIIGIVLLALVVVALCAVLAGSVWLRRSARSIARDMIDVGSRSPATVVTAADIALLPDPVERWMRWANVVGRERIRTVRLRQKGEIRLAPDKPWMRFDAEQYYTTDPPAFIWYADVRTWIIPLMEGRDSYIDGHGAMVIKGGGWIPIVDAHGPKLDQAALMRYLSEIIWFPTAALEPCITWTPVDECSARATIVREGVAVSAIFTFDDIGRPTGMTADRYYDAGASSTLERWFTPSTDYGDIRGVNIPVMGSAIWKLKSGDFEYIRIEITRAEYNVQETY
jgi:hypothetical protein